MYLNDRATFEDAGVLLRLLIERPTVHFSEEELSLELDWPIPRVEDSLAELARTGLAHRQDEFAFATRAAVRCHELLA